MKAFHKMEDFFFFLQMQTKDAYTTTQEQRDTCAENCTDLNHSA